MGVINIKCPKCKADLEAEQEYLGMEVSCPDCDETFRLWRSEDELPQYNDSFETIKPGTLAQAALPLSFQTEFFSENQRDLLLNDEFCESCFHFKHSLLRDVKEGTNIDGYSRYWTTPVKILGQEYLVRLAWTETNRKYLIFWLRQMGIPYAELKKVCECPLASSNKKNMPEEKLGSTFTLDDPPITLAYTKPEKITIGNKSFPTVSWKQVLQSMVEFIYATDKAKLLSFVGKAFAKTTKRVPLQKTGTHLVSGVKIAAGVYLELNYSSESIVKLTTEFAIVFGVDLASVSIRYLYPKQVKNEKETIQPPDDKTFSASKDNTVNADNLSDAEISSIDSFSLTTTIVQEMLRRKLLFKTSSPFEKLRTFQWCQNVLNLRYPLIRVLKIYESPDDFKETFAPIPGAESSILICKNQNGLNRQNFLAWLQTIGFSLTDIADLLGVEIDESFETESVDEPEDNTEPIAQEKCENVSDEQLVQAMLTLMYQKKMLSHTALGNLQAMYFCLSNFGITKPIIQRLYSSMLPADYNEYYDLWQSTEDNGRYLILKKYDRLKRKELLRWAESQKLNLDDLCEELHCTREALSIAVQPEAPAEEGKKPTLDCDTAILRFIRLQPGCNAENIVNTLLSQGYDHEKILRRLAKVPGIVSTSRGYFLDGTEPKEKTSRQKNYKPIDDAIRGFVKSNYSVMDKDVISKVSEQDFDPDKVALRLRKHPDVLTIAGHCYVKDSIEDLDEAADILLKTLKELFNRNSGYTSAHELYKSVQAQLDDFFYDNDAFESESEIYQLAAYLFDQAGYKNTHFIFRNNLHIWEREPDYPMGDNGLLILWARENQGILTSYNAYENYKRRGVNEGSLSATFALSMDKVFDKFWMVEDGTYLLKEKISITPDFLQELREQIKMLMAEFEFGFIPMWDIGADWYAGLPSLVNGRRWTPLLLQSIIRDYGKELGVRTIPRQEIRQLHAAIVESGSDLQYYSDLVYCAIRNHNPAKSVTVDRNELFEWLIDDGLWPQEITPSYGSAFQNLFKDNIHFHVADKNKVVVV